MEKIRIRPNDEVNSIKKNTGNNIIIGLVFFEQPTIIYRNYIISGFDETWTKNESKSKAQQVITQLNSMKTYFDKKEKE